MFQSPKTSSTVVIVPKYAHNRSLQKSSFSLLASEINKILRNENRTCFHKV